MSPTILKNHGMHFLSNTSDPQFLSAEDFTFRFIHQITQLSRSARRIHKSYGEAAGVEADLGRGYNAWSLVDSDISRDVEEIGTVFDGGAVASSGIAEGLEGVGEGFNEYVAFGKVVEKLLKARHKKHADWEGVVDAISAKQATLAKLEDVESESQRISAALLSEGSGGGSVRGGGGILAKINSWVDNDPELTRRNGISRARDAIAELTDREVEAKVCRVYSC
jgi:hypothetical protein